jgi:hypothetical protein
LYVWIPSSSRSSRCKLNKKGKELERLSKQQKNKLRKFLSNKSLKNKSQLQAKLRAMKKLNTTRRNKRATISKRSDDFCKKLRLKHKSFIHKFN